MPSPAAEEEHQYTRIRLAELPEALRRELASLDEDHDGFVDALELWKAVYAYRRAKEDGGLSLEIFPPEVQQKLKVREWFRHGGGLVAVVVDGAAEGNEERGGVVVVVAMVMAVRCCCSRCKWSDSCCCCL